MAQESNNNDNNSNNNNKNNVAIPDQISWNSNSEKPIYRGTTAIQSVGQSDNFGIAKSSSFGKNASSSSAISFSSEISGGAIDIDFMGNGNGIKSSYPSIKPIGNKIKPQEPIIQVLEDNQYQYQQQQQQQQQQKANIDEAPAYDGFQPHCAHYSKMDPIKMKETLNNILLQFEQSGDIDYFETSPFVYTGRVYGKYNYCEFRANIFSNESSESVLELRRFSGESFTWGNMENNLIKELTKSDAIQIDEGGGEEEEEEQDEYQQEEDEEEYDFGIGLESLPSLDSMQLDSSTFSSTDIDDDDNKLYDDDKLDINKGIELLENAVDLKLLRDELRSNVAYLNQKISKNEEIFKNIPNIISTIISAINDQIYDCWTIKMYLEMINKLISYKATIPTNLLQLIKNVQLKWSQMVVNQVGGGVKFEFFPSQQIVRNCQQIIQQIQ